MPLILLGLPFVLFGAFSHLYAIEGKGTCLFVDVVNMGPFCSASIAPELTVYGAVTFGLGLMIVGNVLVRRARVLRAKKP